MKGEMRDLHTRHTQVVLANLQYKDIKEHFSYFCCMKCINSNILYKKKPQNALHILLDLTR